jgi:hypothetical protein
MGIIMPDVGMNVKEFGGIPDGIEPLGCLKAQTP